MIRTLTSVLAISVMALMTGCSTLNEAECRNADWRAVGYEDGTRGSATSRVGEHRQACADFGVTPDIDAYRAGHAEGVLEYCTPARGFDAGKRGYTYNGVCSGSQETAFLEGYNTGREHYTVQQQISEYDQKIRSSESKLKQLRKDVKREEARLVNDQTTESQRASLLSDIRKHEREIGKLEALVLEYEKDKAVKESEYEQLDRPAY